VVAVVVRAQRTILIERDDAAYRLPGAVSIVVVTVVDRTSVCLGLAADGDARPRRRHCLS